MADFLRENMVEVLLGLILVSLVAGFLQGWIGIQIQYLFAVLGAIGAGYFFYHRRVKVGWTPMKGVQIAQHYFQKWAGHYVPVKEFYDIADQKRFSRRGRLFIVFGEDGPKKMAVGLDLAQKKIGLLTSDIRSEWGFLSMLYREPKGGEGPVILGKLKEKMEREIKPTG